MFEFLGDAWDTFTGLFDGGESNDGWTPNDSGYDYDFKGNPAAYDKFLTDYGDNQILDSNYDAYIPDNASGGGDFYKSLMSPSVLGALVTSGAGLLGGMSSLSAQKDALKAQQEEKKMNQMLELAKLKYQLMGKGAGGGGGRRSGGGGGMNQRQQIDADASARLAAGYQNLGGNLASIYR